MVINDYHYIPIFLYFNGMFKEINSVFLYLRSFSVSILSISFVLRCSEREGK